MDLNIKAALITVVIVYFAAMFYLVVSTFRDLRITLKMMRELYCREYLELPIAADPSNFAARADTFLTTLDQWRATFPPSTGERK